MAKTFGRPLTVQAASGVATYALVDGSTVTGSESGVTTVSMGNRDGERFLGLRAFFASSAADNTAINYKLWAGLGTEGDPMLVRQIGSGVITVGTGTTPAAIISTAPKVADTLTWTATAFLTNQLAALGSGGIVYAESPASNATAWLTIGDAIGARALIFEFQSSGASQVTPIVELLA